MSTLEQAKELLAAMSGAENAQLLQWVVRDLGDSFPGIERLPGVCGGEACIVRMRIHAALSAIGSLSSRLIRINRVQM